MIILSMMDSWKKECLHTVIDGFRGGYVTGGKNEAEKGKSRGIYAKLDLKGSVN